MKNKYGLTATWLGMILFIGVYGCAGIRTMDTSTIFQSDLSTVLNDPVQLDDLSVRVQQGQPTVIKIPPGLRLPVRIKINTPMAHMQSTSISLYFDREVYLYLDGKGLWLSPDGQRWAAYERMTDIKTLFGFGQGMLSLGLSATASGQTALQLAIEAPLTKETQ